MTVLVLVVAAIIPVVLLLSYVNRKDKADKEPAGLLVKLLLLGALSCIPACLLELIIGIPIGMIPEFYSQNLVSAFIGVGLVEEACKFGMLWLGTHKNKNFNSLFDGILYAVFISLGFAGFENIFYVIENGIANAVVRGVMSVPAHMFNAVFMGLYYTRWHMYRNADNHEKELLLFFPDVKGSSGRECAPVYRDLAAKQLPMALLIPTLLHGAFDFLAFCEERVFAFFFADVILVIVLYVICFRLLKQASSADKLDGPAAVDILSMKYPAMNTLMAEAMFQYQDNCAEAASHGMLPRYNYAQTLELLKAAKAAAANPYPQDQPGQRYQQYQAAPQYPEYQNGQQAPQYQAAPQNPQYVPGQQDQQDPPDQYGL